MQALEHFAHLFRLQPELILERPFPALLVVDYVPFTTESVQNHYSVLQVRIKELVSCCLNSG